MLTVIIPLLAGYQPVDGTLEIFFFFLSLSNYFRTVLCRSYYAVPRVLAHYYHYYEFYDYCYVYRYG